MAKIKFCGLTRPCDIEAANELKPDYIGFVFARKSKRYIDPASAKELKKLLDPNIKAVGVFVDEEPEAVAGLLNSSVIDLAQLHGNEDEEYIKRLRGLTDKPVIKAFRMDQVDHISQTDRTGHKDHNDRMAHISHTDHTGHKDYKDRINHVNRIDHMEVLVKKIMQCSADYVLLDSGAGSGQVFNWSRIKNIDRPYFLAGGLNPSNAGDAVAFLHPFALDVSSGIEIDGKKDKDKMNEFINHTRGSEGD